MQPKSAKRAKPTDVTRVLGNLRLKQNNIQPRLGFPVGGWLLSYHVSKNSIAHLRQHNENLKT